MKQVKITRPDYAANHQAAIINELIPQGTPVPKVKRHENVTLYCTSRLCAEREFTASFDEVQQLVLCPSCRCEVFIPVEYRGMP
jgi:hypothetical protein